MPFVLAPELVAIAASVLLAVLCMAVVYLIRAIAAALPKINFAFVHIDFGKIFSSIAAPAVSWLVGATAELWSDFEWWMHGFAYITVGLFDDVKSLFETHAGQIAHIVTSVIPHAIEHIGSDAASFTKQEVATLERDISSAARDFEKVASKDAAQALAKAKSLVAGAEADITRVGAHAISTAETYADTELAKLRGYVDDAIRAIPHPNLDSIGAAPAALVGTVAGVAAGVFALTKEFEECAVTSCDGPNNLSSLVNGLLGLSGLAAFAAFLDDVVNNPVAAEAEYSTVFTGIFNTADALFKDGTGGLDALLAL